MITRDTLQSWVLEALRANNGSGSPATVARHIWRHHQQELEESGDLLYTWQYDIRWAAQKLRNSGVLVKAEGRNVPWQIQGQT
jgi:hypothetical protein